jgi:hypothetical protein
LSWVELNWKFFWEILNRIELSWKSAKNLLNWVELNWNYSQKLLSWIQSNSIRRNLRNATRMNVNPLHIRRLLQERSLFHIRPFLELWTLLCDSSWGLSIWKGFCLLKREKVNIWLWFIFYIFLESFLQGIYITLGFL